MVSTSSIWKTSVGIVCGLVVSFCPHNIKFFELEANSRSTGGPTNSNYYEATNGVTLENSKQKYNMLLHSGDRKRIQLFHRNLLDYVLGTVSTMFHDSTGGLYALDEQTFLEERRKLNSDSESIFDSKHSVEGEISRLVEGLRDPYSQFISPSDKIFASTDERFISNLGLGLEAYFDSRRQLYRGSEIVAVYPDSPAEKAGLKIGDLIESVNGVNLKKVYSRTLFQCRTPDDFNRRVNQLLIGSDGSIAHMSIASRKHLTPQDPYPVALKRDSSYLSKAGLSVRDLTDESGHHFTYLRLRTFSHKNSKLLMSALADRAHRDVSAVIIDLRNNYGGVMQDALLDAAMFLPNRDDVICYTISPRGVASHTVGTWTKEGTSEAVVNDTPLIILLNEGTASSAELFAAGLHENSRAVLVGSRTFGKSQIQHFFPLPNGGALKLTVAEYLTPKKHHLLRNVEGVSQGGLAPDIMCNYQVGSDPSRDECVILAESLDVADVHTVKLL